MDRWIKVSYLLCGQYQIDALHLLHYHCSIVIPFPPVHHNITHIQYHTHHIEISKMVRWQNNESWPVFFARLVVHVYLVEWVKNCPPWKASGRPSVSNNFFHFATVWHCVHSRYYLLCVYILLQIRWSAALQCSHRTSGLHLNILWGKLPTIFGRS